MHFVAFGTVVHFSVSPLAAKELAFLARGASAAVFALVSVLRRFSRDFERFGTEAALTPFALLSLLGQFGVACETLAGVRRTPSARTGDDGRVSTASASVPLWLGLWR